VNPNPKESNLDVIRDDVLALWQGNGGQSTQEAATPQKIPESLWWYAMLLVFAAAVAESVLASRYLGTQREEQ
jgi:hypothetical protein